MSNNVAKISDLIVSFNDAVANPENRNSDNTINWNFVDADIHMDASEAGMSVPNEWYETFNDLADEIEGIVTGQFGQ